jgi:hypothetical protein
VSSSLGVSSVFGRLFFKGEDIGLCTTFSSGDSVGLGIDRNGTVFFTKNGILISLFHELLSKQDLTEKVGF